MTLDEYLASPDFLVFQDEILRDHAMDAVKRILSEEESIKRHQLHSIPGVIQGAGLAGLRELAQKQKEKNTDSKNKAFWTRVHTLLSPTGRSDPSLFSFLESVLRERGFLEREETLQDRKEQKKIRKRNQVIVEALMEKVLGVYFEHFTCHYFFKAKQGGTA